MNCNLYDRDVALIGGGYWGRNLARNFNALGVLHTLCDRRPETLATYGDDYKSVRKVLSIDEVLAEKAVRKVAIAVPPAEHFIVAKTALEAGKDVFVEKPLCLNTADGQLLVALAKASGRVLMVGHLLQYHPCIRAVLSLALGNELGILQYVASNRLNLGKIRRQENALWSFAPHDISVILSLAGGTLPWRVRCTGGCYITPGIADTTLTTLLFESGLQAHVFVSWLNPFKEQKLTVVGSKAMVVFDDTKPWAEKLMIYRDYLVQHEGGEPVASKAVGEPVRIPEQEPLNQECRHFLDRCLDRRLPDTDGEEGLRVLRVLQAAQSSLDSGGEPEPHLPSKKSSDLQTPSIMQYYAHPSAVIDPMAVIGAGTKIWHFSHIMSGAEIGSGCNLGQNVVVSPGVKLGRNVKVQNNVSIYTGTIVEDDVFLGPSCVLTNVSNPRSELNRRDLYEKTLIRRGSTVGANATIICGVTLGRYSFIAAGAVVTGDVPDYALMVGTPARRRGWMSRHGHPLRFGANMIALCPESGLKYAITGDEQVHCIDVKEDETLPEALSVSKIGYREIKNRQ